MRKRFAIAFVGVLAPGLALAAPVRYGLVPPAVVVGFRAYGLGMLPIDGGFSRFSGTLELDPADPAACTLALQAEAASLHMPTAAMTTDALGPDLLDVGRHPEFRLDGTCAGNRLHATLTLHGVARPLEMEVTVTATTWRASGLMRRAEWGMGARPALAGPEVRVSVTAGLPRAGRP